MTSPTGASHIDSSENSGHQSQDMDMDKWIQDNVKDQWYEITYLAPNTIGIGYTNSPLAPFHFILMAAKYKDNNGTPIYRTRRTTKPSFHVEITGVARNNLLWRAKNIPHPESEKLENVKRDMDSDGGFTVFNEGRGYTNGLWDALVREGVVRSMEKCGYHPDWDERHKPWVHGQLVDFPVGKWGDEQSREQGGEQPTKDILQGLGLLGSKKT